VAPDLPDKDETGAFERADDPCPVDARKAAQAALTSTVAIVVCGSGTGRPSALSASM
jgi:hypothetical protein